ncbi:hypothetical protein BGZ70_002969 [Mortierella alpina]|uniref:Uncharacterized protein n=1 Tax=Mortierella alpina TaxID=64518 RepID=A0A9P6LVM5_MORAP|nr:hypothetical protein BGZ70_002969 [Mortierella alpina]
MTAPVPSTRPFTGLKKKVMYIGQLAILSSLLLSVAGASCTVSTTHRSLYIKKATETNGATLSFATSDGFNDKFHVTCKKGGGKGKKCGPGPFCISYTCTPIEVRITGATYLGATIGLGKNPSASGTQGAYTYDDYWSCY